MDLVFFQRPPLFKMRFRLLDGAGYTALAAWVPVWPLAFQVYSPTPLCCSQEGILDVSVQMTLGVHWCISILSFKCLKLPVCLLCSQQEERG